MSHREKATYFLTGVSKSSNSVDQANNELIDCMVNTQIGDVVAVYGEITENNALVLDKHFELCDNIFDVNELALLEE